MADLTRTYVKTPQLVQTGVQLPPVPASPDDWEAMRRLLEAIRQAVNRTDGLSEEFTVAGTDFIFKNGKLISIEQ